MKERKSLRLRLAVQYVRGSVDGKTTKPLISVQFLEAVILRIKKCHVSRFYDSKNQLQIQTYRLI